MKYIYLAYIVAAYMIVATTAQGTYTTKYDNVNIDEILKSDRLLNNYFKCLMDKGSCTPEAQELKRAVPDALQTECSKCSEKQKQAIHKVANFLIDNKPEQWKQLQAKYDPNNVYFNKYRNHL
ncbi:ejaculatory bulb-specific protein 3-like [Musca vetustissima]|uniref:ejaculatory bulb-specific protein 3-like n=1 Tax=Musca vetustissima TaxID=27455 RepID=UPI002AB69959|nr:ejaculatory bulb-specific protein 3-like [Musca vetustissima]